MQQKCQFSLVISSSFLFNSIDWMLSANLCEPAILPIVCSATDFVWSKSQYYRCLLAKDCDFFSSQFAIVQFADVCSLHSFVLYTLWCAVFIPIPLGPQNHRETWSVCGWYELQFKSNGNIENALVLDAQQMIKIDHQMQLYESNAISWHFCS